VTFSVTSHRPVHFGIVPGTSSVPRWTERSPTALTPISRWTPWPADTRTAAERSPTAPGRSGPGRCLPVTKTARITLDLPSIPPPPARAAAGGMGGADDSA